MELLTKSQNELYQMTIEQIDEILSKTEVDVALLLNKDLKKLQAWNLLCGILIDIRCEKLGIKI